MSFDGCAECNLALEALRDDAKMQKRALFVCWVDLRNAFGSVPHDALLQACAARGLPARFLDLLRSAYEGGTLELVGAPPGDAPIREVVGLKQGCPLSPLLFNVYLDPVLRKLADTAGGYKLSGGERLDALAFADDMAIMSAEKGPLQRSIDVCAECCATLGLEVNAAKTPTIGLQYASGRTGKVLEVEFEVDGVKLEPIRDPKHFRYLGRPFGREEAPDVKSELEAIGDDARAIECSYLAPWHKMEAVQSFLVPPLDDPFLGGATFTLTNSTSSTRSCAQP